MSNEKSMRKTIKSQREKEACRRIFSCEKVILELLTIFSMVIVALFATTNFNTAQLRFGNYITDKFVDEEFDSHIKKTFYDVANVDEFWSWIDGPFIGGIYPGGDYVHAKQNPIDEVSTLITFGIRSFAMRIISHVKSSMFVCFLPYATLVLFQPFCFDPLIENGGHGGEPSMISSSYFFRPVISIIC